MRINAVCHNKVMRRWISRSISPTRLRRRGVSGAASNPWRSRSRWMMRFCTSKTVRRRVSVGWAVNTGETWAVRSIFATSPGVTESASRSLASTPSSDASGAACPASSRCANAVSSSKSSAILAISAK